MGLIERFSRVVRAKLNSIISSAENPSDELDLKYEEMRDELTNIESSMADVKTQVKRLEMQRNNLEEQIEEHNEDARIAVDQGREDLARKVLNKKQAKMNQVEELDTRINDLKDTVDGIREKRDKLQTKIEEFKTKKEVKKAEYKAAEAQADAVDSISGMGEFSMENVMSDMEDDIEEMEARAQAIDEMSENEEQTTLEDELRDTEVEQELNRLKGEAGVVEDDLETEEVDTKSLENQSVQEELEALKE
jgi:phage shock protein A